MCQKLQGKYILSSGDKRIESANLITTAGKTLMRRVLSKQADSLVEAIGIGVGTTAANVADTDLKLEYMRGAVDLSRVNGSVIVYKATFPHMSAAYVHEVGSFSYLKHQESGNFVGNTVTLFESTESWSAVTIGGSDSYAFSSTNARLGAEGMLITAGAASTVTMRKSDFAVDWSGYSETDTIKFGVNVTDSTKVTSVTVSLYSNDSFTASQFTSFNNGYNVLEVTKGNFGLAGGASTDTFSWGNITAMTVTVVTSAATTILLDGIKMADISTTDPDEVMVSRSILGSPFQKLYGTELQIEYQLTVGLS